MSKLLDKFNENYKDIYNRNSADPSLSSTTGQPYHRNDLGAVAQDLDPTLIGVGGESEQALEPDSISVTRDEGRMRRFEQSFIGQRFTQRQSDAQGGNTWAATRWYNKNNVKDHVDPTVHIKRHYNPRQTLEGLLPEGYENNGRLQGETSDFLISSSGPVVSRLASKHGMLNVKNQLAFGVSQASRGFISNKINALLAPVNRLVSKVRGQLGDASIEDRPEIEFEYLSQIYKANIYVGSEFQGHAWGHKYLPDSDIGVYTDLQSTAIGIGHRSITRPSPNKYEGANRLLLRAEQGISRAVSGGVNSLGRRLGLSSDTINLVRRVGARFLPRATDINLIRNVRRTATDIDDIVNSLQNIRRDILADDETQAGRLITILGEYKDSSWEADVDATVKIGTDTRNWTYMQDVRNYLNSGTGISIGKGSREDNILTEPGSVNEDNKDHAFGTKYYKDLSQVNLDGSIFKRDIPSGGDSDSIDVIFDTDDEPVRFRAFISDIQEQVNPTMNESNYIGRIETFYTYQKVVRELGFSLILHAFSPEELGHILNKVNYLSSLAYPHNTIGGYIKPTILKFTVGKLYKRQSGIITGISHAVEDNASWDIDRGLPMTVKTNISIRILDNRLHTHSNIKNQTTFMYGPNSSRGVEGGVEGGFVDRLVGLQVSRITPNIKGILRGNIGRFVR